VTYILVRCEFQYSAAAAVAAVAAAHMHIAVAAAVAAAAHMHMVQLTGPHIPESDKAMTAMCTALTLAPINVFYNKSVHSRANISILQLSPSSAKQGLGLNLFRF
jgi:hypothetical protein